jgi:hypothetical protein
MEGKKLTDTAKKYICQLYDSQQRGVSYSTYSREMHKGILVENEAIKMISEYLNIDLSKNEQKYENEWIEGTPDVIFQNNFLSSTKKTKTVLDVKCPFTRANWLYSLASYRQTNKIPTEYYWQLQGYMMLTGAELAILAYVLVDTPVELLYREEEALHRFGDVERIKLIYVQRNDADIQLIAQKVTEANDWSIRFVDGEQEEQDIDPFSV